MNPIFGLLFLSFFFFALHMLRTILVVETQENEDAQQAIKQQTNNKIKDHAQKKECLIRTTSYTSLDMFKQKTKPSTKRQPIAPATKQKSAGNSTQRSNVKGPTKKAKNNRKRPASESGDDTSSDEQTKGRHPQKKTKYGKHHDKEDEDVEEIDDPTSEDPEEVERNEDPVGEKVSY
jgi:hypothetical protein